jgi:hypothetical protein
MFACECGYKCSTIYSLNRHRSKTYNCDECDSTHKCLSGLRKHKLEEHNNKNSGTSSKLQHYPDAGMRRETGLQLETSVRKKTEDLVCECGYICRDKSKLIRHTSKAYNCNECESIYQCHNGLKNHAIAFEIISQSATKSAQSRKPRGRGGEILPSLMATSLRWRMHSTRTKMVFVQAFHWTRSNFCCFCGKGGRENQQFRQSQKVSDSWINLHISILMD